MAETINATVGKKRPHEETGSRTTEAEAAAPPPSSTANHHSSAAGSKEAPSASQAAGGSHSVLSKLENSLSRIEHQEAAHENFAGFLPRLRSHLEGPDVALLDEFFDEDNSNDTPRDNGRPQAASQQSPEKTDLIDKLSSAAVRDGSPAGTDKDEIGTDAKLDSMRGVELKRRGMEKNQPPIKDPTGESLQPLSDGGRNGDAAPGDTGSAVQMMMGAAAYETNAGSTLKIAAETNDNSTEVNPTATQSNNGLGAKTSQDGVGIRGAEAGQLVTPNKEGNRNGGLDTDGSIGQENSSRKKGKDPSRNDSLQPFEDTAAITITKGAKNETKPIEEVRDKTAKIENDVNTQVGETSSAPLAGQEGMVGGAGRDQKDMEGDKVGSDDELKPLACHETLVSTAIPPDYSPLSDHIKRPLYSDYSSYTKPIVHLAPRTGTKRSVAPPASSSHKNPVPNTSPPIHQDHPEKMKSRNCLSFNREQPTDTPGAQIQFHLPPAPQAVLRTGSAIPTLNRKRKSTMASLNDEDDTSSEQEPEAPPTAVPKSAADDASLLLNSSDSLAYSWDCLRLGTELGTAALNEYLARLAGAEQADLLADQYSGGDGGSSASQRVYSPLVSSQQTLRIMNTFRTKTCPPPPGSELHNVVKKNPSEIQRDARDFDSVIDNDEVAHLIQSKTLKMPSKTLARLYEAMCNQDIYDGLIARQEAPYTSAMACVDKLRDLENRVCDLKLREAEIMQQGIELGLVSSTAEETRRILGFNMPSWGPDMNNSKK